MSVHSQDLIPITEEIAIPFEFHRFIVGQRGRWIRGLMDDHDVNIVVPSAEKNVCHLTCNIALYSGRSLLYTHVVTI